MEKGRRKTYLKLRKNGVRETSVWKRGSVVYMLRDGAEEEGRGGGEIGVYIGKKERRKAGENDME